MRIRDRKIACLSQGDYVMAAKFRAYEVWLQEQNNQYWQQLSGIA